MLFVAGNDMDDLKKAIIAELKLAVTPDRVRLLRKVEGGGAPVLLDSHKLLAEQGVSEGSTVVVEVMRELMATLCSAQATGDASALFTLLLPALHTRALSHTAPPHVLASLGASADPVKVPFVAGNDLDDLKKAIIAQYKLALSPNHVRLLRKVEGGGAPVLLNSHRLLAEQGVREGSSVVVEEILIELAYRLKVLKGQQFKTSGSYSASTFASLIEGRSLYHVRAAKGGDKDVGIIVDLNAAAAVLNSGTGDYLLLDDPGIMMKSDVSKLNGFSKNIADGFEQLSNKALVINEDLLRAYGGKLVALNDGRGVTFYKNKDGNAFVECDGLVKNTEVVLLNEAKTHFHEDDAAKLRDTTAVKLREIMTQPELYFSEPADVLEQLQGLKIVMVASGSSFSVKAREACASAGIHQLEQDGTGFVCTLAS